MGRDFIAAFPQPSTLLGLDGDPLACREFADFNSPGQAMKPNAGARQAL
jgi:hypothetical protein